MLSDLNHHFLIAMPKLADPKFAQTVTYIYEHDDEHALGVVINRPLNLTLGDLLDHMNVPTAANNPQAKDPIFFGGPVCQEQGIVVHSPHGDWDATVTMADDIGVTISRDILTAIANGDGPQHAMLTLGYAGWGPGQLERELAENAWLSAPAKREILFSTPIEQRWQAAAALLGVDLTLLSGDVGHA